MRGKVRLFVIFLLSLSLTAGCGMKAGIPGSDSGDGDRAVKIEKAYPEESSRIPEYSGTPYVILDDNVPAFSEDEYSETEYESYSPLDELGRCGAACANISRESMPKEERGLIGDVRPTGWHTVKYSDLIEDRYLYNRCHLIGYQLTGENENELNLITGTRYMNIEGMLPFENQVADYVRRSGNHVLYRVTPVFEGDNLLASGVIMEAESVEDKGAGICFHVYIYNVQPGIEIDYATGDSRREESVETAGSAGRETSYREENLYILNIGSGKFHRPNCDSVNDMSQKNKVEFSGSREELIRQGYSPCRVCNP